MRLLAAFYIAIITTFFTSQISGAWFTANTESVDSVVATASCFGNGGLYVSQQSVNVRQTGNKYKLSIDLLVRNDSDGDCLTSSSDDPVGGADVGWELIDSASGALIHTRTGSTDVSGSFYDQNINVPAGDYIAAATLSLDGYPRSIYLDFGNPLVISVGNP